MSEVEDKTDIKSEIIQALTHSDIKIKPQGYSMYPLIVPGRDYAILTKVDADSKLKRGDVVMYRRRGKSDKLVLHRIWKVKNNEFFMVGDNQSEVEGPLERSQIKAKLIRIERNGKEFGVNNLIYRLLSWIWLIMRPYRMYICRKGVALKNKVRIYGNKRQ